MKNVISLLCFNTCSVKMAILVKKIIGIRKVSFSSMAYCFGIHCRVTYTRTSAGQQMRK
jgi:hypothetical protein